MGTSLHTLTPPEGHRKKRKRIGRGPGSGRGKTATRGHKGQLTNHSSMPAHFEGGQLPIHRRIPKRGFTNIHRVEVFGLNLRSLEASFDAGAEVDIDALHSKGLIPKSATVIKLLADGELTKKLSLKIHRISASARQKLEASGSTVELIPVRVVSPTKDAK